MITPPQEHFVPAILVAAKLAGVGTIYQVGGAQGIALGIWDRNSSKGG